MAGESCNSIPNGRPCDLSPGGGGGGACTTAVPLAFGNDNVQAGTATRYLSPAGDFSSGAAGTVIAPYIVQASSTLKRLQIRIETGAGNGSDVVYTVLLNGVPTGFAITLASTFSGVADIVGPPLALVDGDELAIEVTKAASIGSSPSCIQGFLQIENACGGGGGGGSCCAPQYLSEAMYGAFAENYIATAGATMELDASVCGQNEPLTAVIRPSELPGGGAVAPAVTVVSYNAVRNTLSVTWDDTGSDGLFVLEITNDCGCCYVHPLQGLLI